MRKQCVPGLSSGGGGGGGEGPRDEQGWALTRIRNLSLVLQYDRQGSSTVAVCGTEP